MSEAKSSAAALPPGQVLIIGRIQSKRRIQTMDGPRVLHNVRMPAPDSYSHPATVEVSAAVSLGDRDEDVRIVCRVSGSPRSYDSRDKETGEVSKVQTADIRLIAVE